MLCQDFVISFTFHFLYVADECLNGGTRNSDVAAGSPYCSCAPGYTGEFCGLSKMIWIPLGPLFTSHLSPLITIAVVCVEVRQSAGAQHYLYTVRNPLRVAHGAACSLTYSNCSIVPLGNGRRFKHDVHFVLYDVKKNLHFFVHDLSLPQVYNWTANLVLRAILSEDK